VIVLKKQEILKKFLEKNGDAVIIGSKHVLFGEKNIYDITKNNVLVIAPEKTGKDYGITYPTIVEGWKGNKIILDMQKRVSGSIGKFLKEESSVWTFYPGDKNTLKYNPFENIDFEKESCKEKIVDFLLEDEVMELLSKNEVDLKRIMDSETPRNFFFGCNFYDKTLKKWNGILKILLHQFSEYSKQRGSVKEVLLILTEPFELGKIENFAKKIKTFNENNIRVFLAFNFVNQIEGVYGKEAKEILDLFETKVFFTPGDNETAKYISNEIGTNPVEDYSCFLKTISIKENLRKLSPAKEVIIIKNNKGHKNVFICDKNLLMDKYLK